MPPRPRPTTSRRAQVAKVTAEQAETVNTISQKRYAFSKDSVAPQLAVKEAEVARPARPGRLRLAEADALNVRAGMRGILQVVPVEVGAQVQPGANLARVADPTRLKAEIQIAETQAKDILIGQGAEIDTRNGIASGKVSRVDPSVQNGTVTVDVALPGVRCPRGPAGPLGRRHRSSSSTWTTSSSWGGPPSARSTRRREHLQARAPTAFTPSRTPVQLGRSSVNTIEIVKGLEPGDRVILSDMSQWDSNDRIKLN
jgi:HlyD family secretion protein